jgi:hypothetical protein
LRQVILHYHFFKNAGSTLDSMLERTFGKRWVNHDKSQAMAFISGNEIGAFIEAHPELLAISSHQAVLPLPQVEGVEIVPALFLRHPLDRVRSVYEFERRQGQQQGPVTKGADHASRLSFADYLRWRFDSAVNGVVHNFQTVRMVFHPRFNRHPLNERDRALAWSRLQALSFFGLVERFDDSILLLSRVLRERGIAFETQYEARNQSKRENSLEQRLERMRAELGQEMWEVLLERNKHDLELYERAEREFGRRLLADHELNSR